MLFYPVEVLFALRAVQDEHFQLWCKTLSLLSPIRHEARRRHYQAWTICAAGIFFQEQVCEGLDGFAQAHIVRQNPRKLVLAQELQPIEALLLIRTELCLQLGGRSDR